MAKNLGNGSKVRYYGDLPEGWGPRGLVVALADDASGDRTATVDFDGLGRFQDIPESELERDPLEAQDYDDDGSPFA